jgi:hypothetical protein
MQSVDGVMDRMAAGSAHAARRALVVVLVPVMTRTLRILSCAAASGLRALSPVAHASPIVAHAIHHRCTVMELPPFQRRQDRSWNVRAGEALWGSL